MELVFAARWQPEKTTPGRSQEHVAGGAIVFVSRMKSLSFQWKFSKRNPVAAAELMLSSNELEYRRRSK
jgi:hypothetical protein